MEKHLDDLKVSELKLLLGQRGLKKSGRKSDLQQRLLSAIANENGDGQAKRALSDNTNPYSMNYTNDHSDVEAAPPTSVINST